MSKAFPLEALTGRANLQFPVIDHFLKTNDAVLAPNQPYKKCKRQSNSEECIFQTSLKHFHRQFLLNLDKFSLSFMLMLFVNLNNWLKIILFIGCFNTKLLYFLWINRCILPKRIILLNRIKIPDHIYLFSFSYYCNVRNLLLIVLKYMDSHKKMCLIICSVITICYFSAISYTHFMKRRIKAIENTKA